MCSYCGCEAEPVIEALMIDHAVIESQIRVIAQALEEGDRDAAAGAIADLSRQFERHIRMEEAGLFMQLRLADEAGESLDRLTGQHRQLMNSLRRPDLISQEEELMVLLDQLSAHAEEEDTDIFPFAMQVLANPSWSQAQQVLRAVQAEDDLPFVKHHVRSS